jgi:predicted Zn-dependent protease
VVLLVACHHAKPVVEPPLSRAGYAHYLAGKAALYHGDADDAVEHLALAAKADPDQPMIVVEEAHALVKAKRAGEAVGVLADARRRWPKHAEVWLVSAEVAETGGEASRVAAIAAYKRSIELAPDEERGYLGLARMQEAAGDARAVESTLASLVKHVPASVEGHYRLAQRLAKRREDAVAIRELRAVLELDPDHIDARLDLARVLRRTGKLSDAIAQTRSAFDRAGQSLDIAEELFWLLCEADDLTAALDLLTLLDDDRSDIDALLTVARLQIGLGRFHEAEQIAVRIAAQDRDAEEMLRIGLAVANRDVADAEKRALAVRSGSRFFANAHRVAAEALLSAHEARRALDLIEPARRAKPDDLEIALVAAMALADLQRVADATAALDAVKTDEDRRTLARARLAEHRGDRHGAVALLVPFMETHAENGVIANLTGYLLADLHEQLDLAARLLGRARELDPGDPTVLDSWGWLLLARGNTKDAVRALDRASRFAPFEPEILLHLAVAVAADGDPAKATQLLDRAAAMRPYPDVADRIARARSTLPPRR